MRTIFGSLGGDLDHLEDEYQEHRFWEHLDDVPDASLWQAHVQQKQALQAYAQVRLRRQLARHGEAPAVLAELADILDPGVLTIGFARRMATYKRAALLFSDMERLTRLVGHPERPVQLVFAGKAHPADRPGQRVIQRIFEQSRSEALRGRVVILEDYDMRVGRYLVEGVDVWLNNPRRPLEASGTSGMKAAMNGTPHMSIGDGWWAEGYTGDNGWLIDAPADPNDHGAQDWADVQALYALIEQQLVPAFYERDAQGIPRRWIQVVKQSIRTVLPRFSTRRMVKQYVREMYVPALGQPLAK
jgi:starch phosphorylase